MHSVYSITHQVVKSALAFQLISFYLHFVKIQTFLVSLLPHELLFCYRTRKSNIFMYIIFMLKKSNIFMYIIFMLALQLCHFAHEVIRQFFLQLV